MQQHKYLMESKDESFRLDLKTDSLTVEKQALWAGLKPGMRVADIGCGSGKTASILHQLVKPEGETVGIDFSEERLRHAKQYYNAPNLSYICRNINASLKDLGKFDFIWMRFFLEYHNSKSFNIVKNISECLKPGGIMCLIDLDYNCLNHYGIPDRLEKTICKIVDILQHDADFDPYVGKKLYSFLYDLGYEDIDVTVAPHHLIFGKLKVIDEFNWTKKVEVAVKNSGFEFEDYKSGYDGFLKEFREAFSNPRRFTYTPVIACRGTKAIHD